MKFEEILQRVIQLAQAQFEGHQGAIEEGTTASDIHQWNSLSHVMMVTSIEGAFGIKFDLLQMIDMKSIGDIARVTFEAVK
jgi:acyl carrier protein